MEAQTAPAGQSPAPSRWFARAGLVALILAAIELLAFGLIGVGRQKDGFSDAIYFYAAGHAWLARENPYQPPTLRAHSAGVLNDKIARFYYPPHSAPLCMALGLFSYPVALVLFRIASVLAGGILCFVGVQWVRHPASSRGRPDIPWLLAALICGAPWLVDTVWGGGSSPVMAAFLMGGWYFAQRGRDILAGVLLGVATVKPQFALLPMVWLLCERRWKLLGAAAGTGLLFLAYPVAVFGVSATFGGWIGAIRLHHEEWCNALGWRHLMGIPNLFFALGVTLPDLRILAVALTIVLWCVRRRFQADDVLGILNAMSVSLMTAHDYDVLFLVPVLASLWLHLADQPRHAAVALSLAAVLLIPDQLISRIPFRGVDQRCTLATLILLAWLIALSFRRVQAREEKGLERTSPAAIPGSS